MKNKLFNLIQRSPIFLYLLPVFFVLHGVTENYNLITIKDASILAIFYLGASIGISLIFWLIFRNFYKANLVAFFLMAFNFFFGNIHDLLKSELKNTLLVKYSFILPVSLICFIMINILIKKSNKLFIRTTQYLNYLFCLLILFEIGFFFVKYYKNTNLITKSLPKEFSGCDSCYKPDILLIVADEYANSEELKLVFNFDNSSFETDLIKRGFHIIRNAKSNYNSTLFSIASMFEMKFIDSLGTKFNNRSLNAAYKQINENILTKWLQDQSYEIVNHSAFPLANIPNPISSDFFTTGTDLITLHTLVGRLNRDIRWNFITRFKIKSEIKKFVRKKMNNNQALINKTIIQVNQKSEKPRFFYLHLMLPHFPYLVDKGGNPNYQTSFSETNRFDKTGYLDYLQYSNSVFLNLIDKIQTASPNAIIIFIGDHGFRHMVGFEEGHFMNFNSIYLPQKKYSLFYDGMSLVNEFRILLNTQFNQKLPLLKDSTVFLTNWW